MTRSNKGYIYANDPKLRVIKLNNELQYDSKFRNNVSFSILKIGDIFIQLLFFYRVDYY